MDNGLADRPYSVAVYEAMTVYLDVIRPWMIRNMPQDYGKVGMETLVKNSIRLERQHGFQKQLDQEPGDIARALDVAHIVDVVDDNWSRSFASKFGDDTGYRNKMSNLAKRRNQVCHPGHVDLTKNNANNAFSCIRKIAKHIGRDDAVAKIGEIEQRLNDRLNGTGSQTSTIDPAVIEGYERKIAALSAHTEAIENELKAHMAECPSRKRGRLRKLLRRFTPRITVSFGPDEDAKPSERQEAVAELSVASIVLDGVGVDHPADSPAVSDSANRNGIGPSHQANGARSQDDDQPSLYEPGVPPVVAARRNGAG